MVVNRNVDFANTLKLLILTGTIQDLIGSLNCSNFQVLCVLLFYCIHFCVQC